VFLVPAGADGESASQVSARVRRGRQRVPSHFAKLGDGFTNILRYLEGEVSEKIAALASRYIIFDQAFKSSKTTAENAAVPQPVERKDLGGKFGKPRAKIPLRS
jgi:hypothetical protein